MVTPGLLPEASDRRPSPWPFTLALLGIALVAGCGGGSAAPSTTTDPNFPTIAEPGRRGCEFVDTADLEEISGVPLSTFTHPEDRVEEHRLFADHTAPQTKSHVVYKGALQGQGAHTVWIGNVLIRKVAEGIETYEENRNLVLTDGCQADSVPNLEIETGEIEGAGHASATARFDDEQLFYLRSRGVSEKEAQRLVVHGFFNDLIRKVGVPAIEEKLMATVEAELAKNVLKEIG